MTDHLNMNNTYGPLHLIHLPLIVIFKFVAVTQSSDIWEAFLRSNNRPIDYLCKVYQGVQLVPKSLRQGKIRASTNKCLKPYGIHLRERYVVEAAAHSCVLMVKDFIAKVYMQGKER